MPEKVFFNSFFVTVQRRVLRRVRISGSGVFCRSRNERGWYTAGKDPQKHDCLIMEKVPFFSHRENPLWLKRFRVAGRIVPVAETVSPGPVKFAR
jgi:hypothetical protein